MLTRLCEDFARDTKVAVRQMSHAPGFAGVAILTLALGIGANTAIFSVVSALLLRPLPYNQADRLVRIVENVPPRPGSSDAPRRGAPLAISDLQTFRQRTHMLSHVGVYLPAMGILRVDDERVRVTGIKLSADILSMIDAQPRIGRRFEARDEVAGADRIIILSHRIWQRYFAGAPDAIGRHAVLDDVPYVVVGVMPDGFEFPNRDAEFWIPFAPPTAGPAMQQRLAPTARLRDGVSRAAAASEIDGLLSRMRRIAPEGQALAASGRPRFEIASLEEMLVAPVKTALLVIVAAVGLVLLLACVNVTNLLLARTAA